MSVIINTVLKIYWSKRHQMEMKIFYDGIDIGTRRVDFFVAEFIMVELKAVIKLST